MEQQSAFPTRERATAGFPASASRLQCGILESHPEGRMSRVPVSIVLVALAGLPAGTARAQDAAAGAKVFADQKCSVCHSIGGKGNAKGPLDGVGSKLSSADIRAWIEDAAGMTTKTNATRKPAMKSYTLAKGDVDNLVAYLSSLKK
jgi:mono/diheme cytochrome c family protein